MSEVIQAFPLQWPAGWRRAINRERAQFNKKIAQYRDVVENGISKRIHAYNRKTDLSMFDSTNRVLDELSRMGIDREDIVISTNVELRMDGLPKSGKRAPSDPGVCVYWRRQKETRCMAIDRYDRVEDNVAAVAATLDAMRAIDRHGGAAILDRAFMGFTALAAPISWWQVLKLSGPNVSEKEIQTAWRRLISDSHPDNGGSADKAAQINRARDQGLEAIR